MSVADIDKARQTLVEFKINNADVTPEVQECLISATFTDSEDGQSDDFEMTLADREGSIISSWLNEEIEQRAEANQGKASKVIIVPTIRQINWNGDGKDISLDCGSFELDDIAMQGPPQTVTMRGAAMSYNSSTRTTKKSRAWEKTTLRNIAQEIANAGGYTLMYLADTTVSYSRIEQDGETDAAFLQSLCTKVGMGMKVTDGAIILFEQKTYESKTANRTLTKGDGSYSSYNFQAALSKAYYTGCVVTYEDGITGTTYQGVYPPGTPVNSSTTNNTDGTSANASSTAQAATEADSKASGIDQTYLNYAIEMQSKYGCPASVLLGQFVYESVAGTSHMAQAANNCFGIKGTGPAGSYTSSSGSKWRKYNNKKESFEDYAKLVTNARYSKYTGNSKDPQTFLQGLVKGGYCPDAGYVSAVMKIINSKGLTKFDSMATTSGSAGVSSSASSGMKDIVDIAISQLGQTGGKPYWSYLGFKSRVAWCQCFVSWCAGQAGMSTNICPKTGSTDTGMAWFKQRGLFKYKGSYTPKRGDWIYFKTGASHVGLVEYSANGKVYTVEGNASNTVKRNSYSLSNRTITGYGVPQYTYIKGSNAGTSTSDNSSNSNNSNASNSSEDTNDSNNSNNSSNNSSNSSSSSSDDSILRISNEKVTSNAEAEKLATARLREANKGKITASFVMPGDVTLCAGLTIAISGFGGFDGNYYIEQARHAINRSGYKTTISLRQAITKY